MNALVVNMSASTLYPGFESVCLRSAYLLCDKITSAGDSYYSIYYEQYESMQKIENKISHIDNCVAKAEDKGDWNAAFIKETLKSLGKIKHPSPADIITRKKVEKYVNDLYAYYSEITRSKIMLTGMPQLQNLFEKNKDFGLHCVDISKPENELDVYVPLSKIMKRQLPLSNNADLFCLPTEFFGEVFFSTLKIGISANSREARKGKGYVQHCFSLPNVNLLTVLEMEAIHEEVKKVSAPFLEKSGEWMKMVYEGKAPADTAHFLDKEVLPATAVMLHLLSQNSLLENIDLQQNNELAVDVFLGELDVETIWEFYKHHKVLQDDTWKLLEQVKQPDFKNKRWPIMAVRTKNISMDIADEEKTEQPQKFTVAPVKKSISID
jgi:hypothetical protein